ncbi:MAG: hypothetical protein ACYC0F_18165 [Rhodanobacter sp.]
MWEALAALLTIAGLLVKHWLAAQEKKESGTYENDTANFDQALAGRDADALSAAFEQLRPPAGDGDPGGPDDPAPAERKL